MLIRPHDAATTDDEWRNLLRSHPFGTLIAPGTDRDLPVVVPTHVHFDGDATIRLHLARPNPVWPALRENARCLFVVVAAVTYVPTSWEAPPGTPPEWGIPTSHYAAVELDCTATMTDDPADIRRYLADQLGTMQPDELHGDPRIQDAPYTSELRQIRGLELAINQVRAKFKFDGAEPAAVRQQVVDGYRRRTPQATVRRSSISFDATRPPPRESVVGAQDASAGHRSNRLITDTAIVTTLPGAGHRGRSLRRAVVSRPTGCWLRPRR